MECASAYVDLNCDEEEEVEFAEEENLLDRGSFQHVAKSKTSSSSSSSSSPSNARAPQPTQQKRRRVRKANTNIIQISLGTLTEDATVSTGDPLFCNKCGVAFSHLDVLKLRKSEEEAQSSSSTSSSSSSSSESTTSTSSEDKGKDQVEVGQWKCSFCDTVQDLPLDEEELPKEESMDYILEPPSEGSAQQASDSNSNLIFCIDISGSMCVTSEIQGKHQLKGAEHRKKLAALNTEGADQWTRGERRDITYVSRLQSVQAAVDAQLSKLQQEHPNRRVGIVTFNNEVTIIGDGTQIPTTITGDKLYDYSQLLDLGRAHSLRTPIKESKSSLSDKLFGLEEGGATALGPALVVSIGLAGENPGSEVVICTDGLSNVGLGQLDEVNTAEKRGEVELFYQQLGNYAKGKGVTINVISIKGTDCSMENLGTLAELTNGEVNIVDPLTITQEFSSILSQPTIATQVGVKLVLHRGLFIRDDEEDDSAQKKESHIERDVGNVTADSSFTFEFGVRTQEEMAKLNVDTTNISTLPFQLQIRYTKLNGMKCMRVISKQQQVTYDKKLAEQEANVDVIGRNCVQQAAKIAQRGDYTRARLHNFARMQILDRTAQSDSKRAVASKWGEQQGKFEKKMNKVQVKEKAEGLLLDDDEEGEASEAQSEKREVRSVARKARRDDKTAKMLWNLRSKRNK